MDVSKISEFGVADDILVWCQFCSVVLAASMHSIAVWCYCIILSFQFGSHSYSLYLPALNTLSTIACSFAGTHSLSHFLACLQFERVIPRSRSRTHHIHTTYGWCVKEGNIYNRLNLYACWKPYVSAFLVSHSYELIETP